MTSGPIFAPARATGGMRSSDVTDNIGEMFRNIDVNGTRVCERLRQIAPCGRGSVDLEETGGWFASTRFLTVAAPVGGLAKTVHSYAANCCAYWF